MPGDGRRADPIWPFLSFAMGNERLVKGAPYSAKSVSEFHQTLLDGNRIDRSRTTLLYRDSEGRTRQELLGPRALIFLNDAPAGRRYLLDPQRKTALLITRGTRAELGPAPPGMIGSLGASVRRIWRQVVHATGLSSSESNASQIREPQVPEAGMPRGPGDGPGDPERDPPGHDGPPPWGGPPPGGPPGEGLDQAWPPGPFVFREPRGRGVETSLGAKDFESVRADGSKTTWTIPAGQVGNEKPITLTSEHWYAPDLFLVLYARDFDPRDGETVYQLQDLKRAEPAPDLFKVPADYAVVASSKGAERAERNNSH